MAGPTASPAYFPYPHRTIEEVDRDEIRGRIRANADRLIAEGNDPAIVNFAVGRALQKAVG